MEHGHSDARLTLRIYLALYARTKAKESACKPSSTAFDGELWAPDPTEAPTSDNAVAPSTTKSLKAAICRYLRS
jgi:hypothetical protein